MTNYLLLIYFLIISIVSLLSFHGAGNMNKIFYSSFIRGQVCDGSQETQDIVKGKVNTGV